MSLFKSITTFGGLTLISRITGFVRDVLIANFLGASILADAFFVALKLPNLFRRFFAEGAFNAAFVPIFSGKLESKGEKDAVKFADNSISFLFWFLLLFVLLFEVFMPVIIWGFAPGFAEIEGKLELASDLSRITFPYLLFISIVSLQSGVISSFGKFAAYGASPIILNLTMIASLFLPEAYFTSHAHALSFGVSLAGFLQILWLRYNLKKMGLHLSLNWNPFKLKITQSVRDLLRKIGPGIVGAGVYQVNLFIDTILVSLVAEGAVSWLYYSQRLNQLPLGVVGAAVGVALLPVLSKHIKAKDEKEACKSQNRAIFYALMLSVPASVALIVMAKPIIAALFQHGAFGQFETEMTSVALVALSFGLPAYVLVKALAPNFFARGDTKTPVKYAVISMIVNIVLNIALMIPFGHVGIAAATSVSAWVTVVLYYVGLKRAKHINIDRTLMFNIDKILVASLLMGGVLYGLLYGADMYFVGWMNGALGLRVVLLGSMILFGLASFVIFARLLGVINFADVKSACKKNKG